jgi:hypothetical protein
MASPSVWAGLDGLVGAKANEDFDARSARETVVHEAPTHRVGEAFVGEPNFTVHHRDPLHFPGGVAAQAGHGE